MRKETIDLLKEIRLGEIYPCCKETDDLGKEKQDVLSKLYRLNVISKTPKGSYKIGNSKHLSKFIELQNFEKLAEYIDNDYELRNGNITHNYNNVSQVNQSSGNIDLKSPINQKIVNKSEKEPNKKSWIEIASWIIGSIVGLFAIYEFLIKNLLAK